jgi:hypothetical protein
VAIVVPTHPRSAIPLGGLGLHLHQGMRAGGGGGGGGYGKGNGVMMRPPQLRPENGAHVARAFVERKNGVARAFVERKNGVRVCEGWAGRDG